MPIRFAYLQLHSFDVEHDHGLIGDREDKPYGNGVLLWFEVDDFDAVMQRCTEMGVEIVLPRHRNPPDGKGGPNHWECWIRDPDGYVIVVASRTGRPAEHGVPASTMTIRRNVPRFLSGRRLFRRRGPFEPLT